MMAPGLSCPPVCARWTLCMVYESRNSRGQPGFAARYGVRDVDWRSLQPMVREFTVNAKILCIEPDLAVLEGRCASLKYSGYDTASASPRVAEILLRSQKFDLLVISSLNNSDLHRIVNFSDGAEVLVLDGLTPPSKLLSLVALRLNRRQRRA
jgi:hypothetical protein